ncbi:MAG TPA: MFS transporter [candidate division Zixibacteria bacterium]|nr:MFS transporter [candidate division Zixibacteria bacterium]
MARSEGSPQFEPLPVSEKLSTKTKLIYGLGDWGTSAATAARSLFWLYFLISVVGLNAGIAGVVILIGRIWDSVNDPLIGSLSDRIDTRWGRRRPFLLFGAIPFGLSFFFLFIQPPISDPVLLAVYYGLVFLLFDTMYTIINVPYSALTPELTEDYDERSSLAGWRIAIAILAALIAGATFQLLAENQIAPLFEPTFGLSGSLRAGYAITAAVWSITLMIPPLILFKTIREPQRVPPDKDPFRPWRTFLEVFSNRPFRIASVVYLLSFTTADIVITVMVWFLIFYLGASTGFVSLVIGLVLGLAFITMPLTVKMMHKFGKKKSYIAAMSIFAIVLFFISQAPPGGYAYVVVAALFAGFGYGAVNVIPWAMVADVVEEDELKSGKRREGIYSGYLVFFRKLATAITIFGVTWILSLTGFIESTTGTVRDIEQPESALLALRIMVGIVPAIMLIVAIIATTRYPLDRERHEDIRRQLEKRRAKQFAMEQQSSSE